MTTQRPTPRAVAWGREHVGLLLTLAVILLLVFYPTYVEDLRATPVIGTYMPGVGSMVVMLVFTMMAVGLNIVVGYAGLLDLGYVAFYAAGAYMAAWFASLQFEQVTLHFGSVGIRRDLPGIHLSIWLVLIMAGIFTMAVGILIGLPTLRLRGDYLAIVTLGFGEIIPQFVRNADNLFGFDLTHGTFGISPIDSPGFGETLNDTVGLPANFQQASNSQELFFWTALLLLLFTVFCSARLRDSRLGRAWVAIREDETAAAAMGVPLMRTKTWSYALGAFFGGIAGAFYASFKSGAFPADFYFNISIFLLCMVILGGMGSIWGVVVGGMILGYLNVEGLAIIGSELRESTGVDFEPTKYQFGIYGVIIVLMMLFRPVGLIPERRHKRELEEGVHDDSLYGAQH
ncbi:MAG: branched-chain amino acid ABC transporter permease [Actinomycetota bacterium]|nr:branched-chain amino acid ABC transporter permease [Actinomycetota bacterium]